VDIYYIDSFKDNKFNIVTIYKIGERYKIIYTINWNLGSYIEIIDA